MVTDAGRVAQIAAWLRVFLQPGQWTELRAWVRTDPNGRPVFHHKAWFDHANAADMARTCLDLEASGIIGCYFVPNPLRSDLATSRRAAKDEDVIGRHWLLIDVDPVRPTGVSSTDAERAAAWDVLCSCRGQLETMGWLRPVIGDSGNGFHLCYGLDWPNDSKSKAAHREILQRLKKRCNSAAVAVDTTTYNASRIWPVYGTIKRKGPASAERPHRYSRLLEIPG